MPMNDTDTQALGRSLADAQQQLESDGYLLVESLCDPEFTTHLLEVSLRRSDQVMSALGAQSIGIGSAGVNGDGGFDPLDQFVAPNAIELSKWREARKVDAGVRREAVAE